MDDNGTSPTGLNFTIDQDNLYKEESITDLKIGGIQVLTPIRTDGSKDETRSTMFLGRTQLNTPQGPIPIQAKIEAKSIAEALEKFPDAMGDETKKVMDRIIKLQEKQKKARDSRIIVPGLNN